MPNMQKKNNVKSSSVKINNTSKAKKVSVKTKTSTEQSSNKPSTVKSKTNGKTKKKVPVTTKKIVDQQKKNKVDNTKNKTGTKNIIEVNNSNNNAKKFSFIGFIKNIFNKKNTTNNSVKDKKVKNKSTSSKKNRKAVKTKTPLFSTKTKKCLIIVGVVCSIIILLECAYFIYQKNYINSKSVYYDVLNSVTIDNTDIVAVGSSNFKYSKYNNYTNGLEKGKLIKYSSDGKIIFEKMYDRGINTTFSSIITIDDGYIVVGSGVFSEEEKESEAREAFIIKYDKTGNIIWEKFYQVVTNTSFNKVIATNNGYVVVGQSIYANMEMGNHTTGGGIIVKYDFDGNELWHNNHGGMKSGNFNDVVEVNGDFYVVGKDATDSANLVKFNSTGEYQWHKNYSYTDSIGFSGIAYLNNYLYVVGSKKILPEGTGDNDNRNTTNTDGLLIKYNLNGEIIFEKTFGGSSYERYNSIIVHRSNLYVVGHTTSTDIGFKVVTDGKLMTGLVIRYDEDGNINKKEILGGSNNDNLTDVATDGGSLYISGYSNSRDGNIVTSKNNGKDYFGKLIQIDYRFRTLMVK